MEEVGYWWLRYLHFLEVEKLWEVFYVLLFSIDIQHTVIMTPQI